MKKGNEFVISIASHLSHLAGIVYLSTSSGRVLEVQLIQSGGIKVSQLAQFQAPLYNLQVKQSQGSKKFLSLYYLTGNDRARSQYEFIESKSARIINVYDGCLTEIREQSDGLITSSGDTGSVNLLNSEGVQLCCLTL